MLTKVKQYLYKKGILKHNTLLEKIKYLEPHKHNINFYGPNYRNNMLDFIEQDIVTFNRQLDYIIRQGLESRYVTVKDISQNSYIYTSYSFWYSDNNKVIENKNEIDRFFNLIFTFVNWYEESITNKTDATLLNNTRRLKPYYANIEAIVDDILKFEELVS